MVHQSIPAGTPPRIKPLSKRERHQSDERHDDRGGAEHRAGRDERKERRDQKQARRVRAAVGKGDEAEHTSEQVVGHFLLRGRVEQDDRRALAECREERTGDRERQ
jgi:hypothetical protein